MVLLCVPARGTGPPTAPVAMGSLSVSDTVCFLRPFLKLSLNRGPNNLKQISGFGSSSRCHSTSASVQKTHKEKLSGWFLLLVCVFFF